MPLDVVARLRAGLDLSRLEDDPGADGVVAVLVDQDERAGVTVALVRVGDDDRTRAQRDRADVVERQLGRVLELLERLRVEATVQFLHGGPHGAACGVCLRVSRSPARSGWSPSQHTVASSSRALTGRCAVSVAETITSPRPMSMSSAREKATDNGATADNPVFVERVERGDRAMVAGGKHDDLVADGERASREAPGVAAGLVAGRPRDPLHRQAQFARLGLGACSSTASRYSSRVGPWYQGVRSDAVHDVVAVLGARAGSPVISAPAEARGDLTKLDLDLGRSVGWSKPTRSILLTAATKCAIPSSVAMRAWRRVWRSTPARASSRRTRDVGVGGAGEHVSGVALVARGCRRGCSCGSGWRRTGRRRRS